jgi:hypothetical protein
MAGLQVDHVVIGVADLDVAAAALRDGIGLAVAGGGRHPGWGTANRIVPLGSSYLELVTVVEPETAAGNVFGRWVQAMMAGGSPLGWAARTDELDGIARSRGLTPVDGSRVDAAGRELRWRLAGVDVAVRTPALPFFITWHAGTPHPGAAAARHPTGEVTLSRLVVGGGAQVAAWLGGEVPGVAVVDGPPLVHQVVLATSSGEVALDGGALG